MPDTRTPLERPRVIVTRHLVPEVEARMRELFDVVLNEADVPLTRDQLAAAMQDCDVLVPTVTDRIDAELIAGASQRLGLIASFGAGTEHIDLAAAAARKILVTNTPGVFTDDTADLAMAMIIGVPRRVREGTALVRRGEWTGWTPSGLLGRKLAGKVLGIIGMGRIGQAVAHRARAFGLEIAYYNRKPLPEAVERMLGARYVADVDALMGEDDASSGKADNAMADLPTARPAPDPKTEVAEQAVAAAKPDGGGQLQIDQVALVGVSGSPGRGNDELYRAMRKVLRQAGWPVTGKAGKTALAISGKVEIGKAKGGVQQVNLAWAVKLPDGKVLGTVRQQNDVPAGSLNEGWGQTAGFAAEAAAEGIFALVDQVRGASTVQ